MVGSFAEYSQKTILPEWSKLYQHCLL